VELGEPDDHMPMVDEKALDFRTSPAQVFRRDLVVGIPTRPASESRIAEEPEHSLAVGRAGPPQADIRNERSFRIATTHID
jgi:hypothetical protein